MYIQMQKINALQLKPTHKKHIMYKFQVDNLTLFMQDNWPIAMKIFYPLFGACEPKYIGDMTVYAIENTIGVNCRNNGAYVFVERDGSVIEGKINRLVETSLGRELTYLESIADFMAAGHKDFRSAFNIHWDIHIWCCATILGKKIAISSRCPFNSDYRESRADAAICARNEYLRVRSAIWQILPLPIAEELAAALSDFYI